MKNLKLLLIHGAGGTRSKWRRIESYLQDQNYEAIDLPGHGENEYNMITSIQDYATYVNELIQEDTILVGHSMGGLIALELAAKNHKVRGVVLAASFYELPVHEKILEKLSRGEYPASLFHASYSKVAEEELIAEERKELDLVPVGVSYADFRATNLYKEGEYCLSNLQIPVYAILGEQDRLLPQGAKELLEKVRGDIKISVLQGAGHYVMVEKPKEFVKELMNIVHDVQMQKNK